MIARADVELSPPIVLSERGQGAADSVIFSGVASADPQLAYPDGIDIVSDEARRDTAEQLRGVPLVSGEDHQAWAEAQARGEDYEVTPLGTVIEADQDATGAVRFAAAVHGSKNIADVRRKPAVSVGYVARYRTDAQGRRVQAGRTVNHLCVAIPRGRDSQARIRADGADMPTLAEMDADALKALMIEIMAPYMERIDGYMKPKMDAPPPEMPAGDVAALEAAKADAAAEKARADALDARLLEIDRARVRADAAVVGLTVTDADVSDRAALGALEAKIAAAALSKVRADAAPNPWHSAPRTQGAPPLPPIAI